MLYRRESMSRYAFFADGNQLWRELAEALASRGHEPTIWLGHPRHLEWVRERFPTCKVFDERALNHGDYDPSSTVPLPFELRRSGLFAQIERAATYSLQRNTRYRPLGYLECRDFCGAMSNFLWTEIKNSEIDAFIASQAPHSTAGLLFAGILEANGYEMLHFDQVPIAPRMVPRRGFDFQSVSLDNLETHSDPVSDGDLSLWIERFVERIKQEEMAYSEERNSRFERQLVGPIGALRRIKYTRAELRAILDGYALSPVHPAPGGIHRATLKASFQASRYKRRKLSYLRQELSKHSGETADGEPFWLFFLHFEPEKTTLPNGDLLGDQLYLVQHAAAQMPRGTKLYVKEHPSQLLSAMNGHVGRPSNFYSDLASIPRVQIVPPQRDLSALIRSAEVILTVTGTVAVEGLFWGKTVVYFGHPWYQNLIGTNSFENFASGGTTFSTHSNQEPSHGTPEQNLKEFLLRTSLLGAISPGQSRYFVEQGWTETFDLSSISEVCRRHIESGLHGIQH